MKTIKKLSIFVLSFILIVNLSACNKGGNMNRVVITMEDGKSMTIDLYPNKAPKTVANFQKLVKEEFYDGLVFHRIVEDFVIQGGDPQGTGLGGSDENIFGEFAANGFPQNDLTHKKGSVAMARAQDPNSASSQFYICIEDQPLLDGMYAVFGQVVKGLEAIEQIEAEFLDGSNVRPVIKTIRFA